MKASSSLRHVAPWLALLVTVLVTQPTWAATMTFSANADTYLRDATPRGGFEFMDVRGGTIDFRGYLRFDLSGLGTTPITSATLSLFQVPGASRNDTVVNGRFALYGLSNVAGNTPQNWDEATFVIGDKGTEDVTTLMGVTDLDDDVAGITETIAGASPNGTIAVSGAPLVSFLQSRLSDGGLATFILSNDDATDRGYGVGTKENMTSSTHPVLTIEVIPEPVSIVLLAAAGLGVVGRLVRRRCWDDQLRRD